MIATGGIPFKKDGKIVGAISVSGCFGERDRTVAEAGAATFQVLPSHRIFGQSRSARKSSSCGISLIAMHD
jgi:hypothetical protein